MELFIEKYDHLGRGIGYINKKVTFCSFGVAGDLLDVKIIKENKKYNEAIIKKIIKPSKMRLESKCPYFNICGGCQFLNVSYENTKDYKIDRVKNILNKNNIKSEVIFVENNYKYNYRNKIELKVRNSKIGYFKNKTNDIIEVDKCLIANESINNTISLIKTFKLENADITIRCNYNNEIMIIIKSDDNFKIDYDLLPSYKVLGIILNDVCIYGEEKYMEKVGNFFFEVSYNSFFQINPYINEKLFSIIDENVSGNVLDLYSGVGTLSLASSKKANKVYGIEVIENAVLNAIRNAKINKVNNVSFILGKVEDKVKYINDDINTIIVDPPRRGLDNVTINKIRKLNPEKIIYISCDTQSLSNNLNDLLDLYNVKKVYALDMFSWTYHVETIVKMERHINK